MPLKIIITKIKCDAIVNPTNEYLSPGGGNGVRGGACGDDS